MVDGGFDRDRGRPSLPHRSPTALASPRGFLDLVAAGLASIAVKGVAACLISFAGHQPRQRHVPVVPASEVVDITPAPAKEMPSDQQFALECIRAAGEKGAAADIKVIRQAYMRWCEDRGIKPLPGAELANRLGAMFKALEIPLEMRDGSIWAVGVQVTEPRALIAAE